MTKQIVVCDDEIHVMRIISLKLMRSNYDVMGVGDIESCWKLLRGSQPTDLLIVDDTLPGREQALQLLRRIRAESKFSRLPIVVLSSQEPDAEPWPEDLRISGIVQKPFSPRELLDAVTGLLSRTDLPSTPPRFLGRIRSGVTST